MGNLTLTSVKFPISVICMTDSATILLAEIDEFLDRSGMTQTCFGILAMNNSSFVRQLRNGGGVTLRTADRVRTFIRDHKNTKTDKKKRRVRRRQLGSHLAA